MWSSATGFFALFVLFVFFLDELLLLLENFETLLVGRRAFGVVDFEFDFVEDSSGVEERTPVRASI